MKKNKRILDLSDISSEKQQAARERINLAVQEGRMPCAQAFAIAHSLEVAPSVVGLIADQMGIRIANCQLGCF